MSSKLTPGVAPDFAVPRPHLAHRLDECWQRRLTLVAAPAGYGKSVLLSQWHASVSPRPVAWLTVDERDHDPVRLGQHLIGALAGIDPGLGRRAGSLLGTPGPRLGDEVVDLLIEDLVAHAHEMVVVLEDLDHVEGAPVLADLSRLVTDAPPWVHFVVASRSDPSLGVHRLRVGGELLELRADDLKFSPDEASRLVQALSGLELTQDQASHLAQITEGWPVAVQLAALSLRGASDAAALARFGATDRGIVDYLSAEVLAWLRPEVRAFLMDVSVLDELDPELCDAVTGEGNASRFLAELGQGALFVVPLGGEARRYRLHRLVRDLLRHDLATDRPDRPAELRRRAAAWCLRHRDPGQAASYLIAAQDWDGLTDLIYEHGRGLWEAGQMETVLAWTQAMPASVRSEQVRLLLTEVALHLMSGRPESSAAIIASLERERTMTVGEQTLADALSVTLVEVANPEPEALVRQARALAALPQLSADDLVDVLQATDPASVGCLVRVMGAKQRLLLGVPGAHADAVAAARAPLSTPIVFQVHALGTLAIIEALSNRPATAEAAGQRALDLVAEHLGEQNPAVVAPLVGLAAAARARGDLDGAERSCESALPLATRWRRWPMVGLLLGELALVELARGAPEAALARLTRYRELTGTPLAPMVADRFAAVERRARAGVGGPTTANHGPEPTASWELHLAEVTLAAEAGDPTLARKVLDSWPVGCSPLGDLEHELALALLERSEGRAAEARARVVSLLSLTAAEGVVTPFTSVGKPALALVIDAARECPSGHAEAVLAALRRAAGHAPELVDPLSDREVEVLRLLPTRMSNAEIGQSLFISTNTVKTHLKHIYQKLEAGDRDHAVQRARELRLL